MKDQMTILIMSCDKFSDLWQGQVEFLEKYWHDREMDTFIVTDKETLKQFDKVSIIVAGEEKEWSERLKFALESVKTEYVFFTLDDYFLREPVDNSKIKKLTYIMKKDGYDYIRLYLWPRSPRNSRIKEYGKFYSINTNDKYGVNLFPSIWKKDFLMKTLEKPRNIWQYEVSLSKTATKINAKCGVSLNGEFKIIDIIRKGKIQRKARKLLDNSNIVLENREIHSIFSEIKYYTRFWSAQLSPKWLLNLARKIAIKIGIRVFTVDE